MSARECALHASFRANRDRFCTDRMDLNETDRSSPSRNHSRVTTRQETDVTVGILKHSHCRRFNGQVGHLQVQLFSVVLMSLREDVLETHVRIMPLECHSDELEANGDVIEWHRRSMTYFEREHQLNRVTVSDRQSNGEKIGCAKK